MLTVVWFDTFNQLDVAAAESLRPNSGATLQPHTRSQEFGYWKNREVIRQ